MAGAITKWENPTGHLTVVDPALPLLSEAWTLLEDLSAMIAPAERRGGDLDPIPGQPGRPSQPEVHDQATFVYKMLISGAYNKVGEPYADHMAGYYSNVFELRTVTDPVDVLVAEDGCRDLTFHFPNDAYPPLTQRARLRLDLSGVGLDAYDRQGKPDMLKRAVLRITLPYGFFA